MKKFLKKLFLLVAVIAAVTVCFAFSVSAESYGDFTYKILPDYTIEITGYKGTATAVTVP